MAWSDRVWDVAVIGGGNAALCAAITAAEAGASVVALEHAPRAMHDRPTSPRSSAAACTITYHTSPMSVGSAWDHAAPPAQASLLLDVDTLHAFLTPYLASRAVMAA